MNYKRNMWIVLGLIWVETVCVGYQQRTLAELKECGIPGLILHSPYVEFLGLR